jgi:ribosomal protein S13
VARIAGIDLPKKKRSEIGLTYITGIGKTSARAILAKAGVDLDKRVGDLNDDEVARIRGIITSEYKVEGASAATAASVTGKGSRHAVSVRARTPAPGRVAGRRWPARRRSRPRPELHS